MKPYEVRDVMKTLSKMDKENMRALVILNTMDKLADMKRAAMDQDNDATFKLVSVAMYLRAFYEGGVV